MFKRPLANLKTAAALRASDRRRFKQRVVDAFGDAGELLVPDGIQAVSFTTALDQQGVAYLAPHGDPLWFTLADELIPSIYTLWKHRDLLPFVATPPSVVPILVGGADLMVPGVVSHSPSIAQGQLVSVCQFNRNNENPTLSLPLAVGRMAVPADQLTEDAKGKAVLLFHTWKDHLWEMGSRRDVPEPVVLGAPPEEGEARVEPPAPLSTYTPQQVTDILHQSLLQAISTLLSPSSFPITSTQFYTTYILPCRPASLAPIDLRDITIKTSTHKTLTSFLRSAEKSSLLTLKTPPKHAQQPDVWVTSVNATHPSVVGHVAYQTLKAAEDKAKRQGEGADRSAEVSVRVLWKPHLESVPLFKGMGANAEKLYTMQEIKTLLNSYIVSQNLVNPNVHEYINLDSLLCECIQHKTKKDAAAAAPDDSGLLLSEGYVKREELLKKVVDKMQDWYEISREGQVTQKKGTLKPIQVVVKVRQGRKANTFLTGFEPFLAVDADTIADDLKRACASATSVSSLLGKRGGAEIMVQGKHAKAVVDYLTSSGAPKKWIELGG